MDHRLILAYLHFTGYDFHTEAPKATLKGWKPANPEALQSFCEEVKQLSSCSLLDLESNLLSAAKRCDHVTAKTSTEIDSDLFTNKLQAIAAKQYSGGT